MSTLFPTAYDAFVDPGPNDSISTVAHNLNHGQANDAIAGMQTYIGISSSVGAATLTGQIKALQALLPSTAAQNAVYAGPATGGTGAPSFRALVVADLPASVALLGATQTFTAAQTFSAGLTGNVTGNVTGSSGSCTGNAASATTAAACTGNAATATLASAATGPLNGSLGATTPSTAVVTALTFNDPTTQTKQISFQDSLATASTILTLAGQQSTSQTLKFPNVTATDTLATLGVVQSFTAAQTFSGGLTGNLTGNASGSSGSCTGNAATATLASACTGALNGSLGATTPSTISATTVSVSGVITSTLAIGTSPFAITSTTVVPNLNVSQLLGQTWANPGTIGGTTPGVITGTTITANTGFVGALTGNLTGNASGSSGSCTGNAATATLASAATGPLNGSLGATTPSTAVVTSLTDNSLSAGQVVYTGTGGVLSTSSTLTYAPTTGLALAPTAASSGVQTAFAITGATNTGQTSATEVFDVNMALNRTVTWATSTPTTQRAFVIQAPTYACNTASQTIATAATVAITGAPSAGTNVTITTPLALWVASGTTQVQVFRCTGATSAGLLTINGTVTPLAIVQSPATSGSPSVAQITGGAHTTLASGVEAVDWAFNFSRTVQFTTTCPVTQRCIIMQAPTYACDTVSQTITTAATLSISGAPVAGTNVSITNSYALRIQAGLALLGGGFTSSANSTVTGSLSASGGLITGLNSALVTSNVAMTGGSTANAPTLTAGPVAGNPTKWIPINDNGTTRYVPAW